MLARFFSGVGEPTRLLLTRAGPVRNPRGVLYSHPGLPLSREGRKSLAQMSRRMPEKPQYIYAADSVAESQAAALLSRLLGVPYRLTAALRERSWGEWEGTIFADVKRRYGALLRRWQEDESGFAPPRGESIQDVALRSEPFLRKMLERHAGETVLLIGNCAVNRVAISLALPFAPLDEGLRFEQNYAQLSELRFYGSDGVLGRLNF